MHFAVYAGCACALVVASRLAVCRNMEQVYTRELCEKLLPFVGITESPQFDDKDALWEAVGRVWGLWLLFRAAGSISTVANGIARRHPEASTAAEEIFLNCIALRAMSAVGLVEAAVCVILPAFPRAVIWSIVRLYCEMELTLDAARSIDGAA